MFSIVFIFISLVLASDTFTGRVVDSYGNPIYGVNIEVLNSNSGSSTDSEGYFIIDNLPEDRFSIKISHIAYNPLFVEIDDISESPVFAMLESFIEADRIVVTGTKGNRHIKDTPMLTHVITNSDIKNASYAGVKEMLEIALPNVQMVASNHGDDRVKIQGLDNKYLTFLVDGDRVTGEYAGNIDFSMFNLSNVDKIEVVEGAMSTLYGSSAIGGVVNILTKKHKDPFWINLSILNDDPIVQSNSLNLGFNYNKINYNLDLVYKNSEGYDLTPQSNFSKTLDEYFDETIQHKLVYSFKDNHNIEFYYKDYNSNIDKYTQVFDQSTFSNVVVFDAPLNRYDDYMKKIKYNFLSSKSRLMKCSYIEEKYSKYYYYPYYNTSNYVEDGESFVQGDLKRKEFNLEFSYESKKHKRLLGLEFVKEDYSAYNIYDINNLLLHESIFGGVSQTKNNTKNSFYIHDQWNIKNNNQLAVGMRYTSDDEVLTSLSYLMKRPSGYNYRFSYSSGYRNPSIKELYYQWTDHTPHIYGNPDLKSTHNNYISISLDKRSHINDFSIDVYRNDIDNMISTEYDYPTLETGGLYYKNYDNVIINGVNVHYFRKITEKLNLRFVYNLTDASSSSSEILEGISKHSLRINLMHHILEKLNMIVNVKYSGEKFNFDQEEDHIGGTSVKKLDAYFISDVYFTVWFKTSAVKFGMKNVFDYKDSSRLGAFAPDVLNNYDPGRRFFIEYNFNFKGEK